MTVPWNTFALWATWTALLTLVGFPLVGEGGYPVLPVGDGGVEVIMFTVVQHVISNKCSLVKLVLLPGYRATWRTE